MLVEATAAPSGGMAAGGLETDQGPGRLVLAMGFGERQRRKLIRLAPYAVSRHQFHRCHPPLSIMVTKALEYAPA